MNFLSWEHRLLLGLFKVLERPNQKEHRVARHTQSLGKNLRTQDLIFFRILFPNHLRHKSEEAKKDGTLAGMKRLANLGPPGWALMAQQSSIPLYPHCKMEDERSRSLLQGVRITDPLKRTHKLCYCPSTGWITTCRVCGMSRKAYCLNFSSHNFYPFKKHDFPFLMKNRLLSSVRP